MSIVLALVLIAIVWLSFRYAWWRPAVNKQYPRILMYHMIAEPRPRARFNGLRVSSAAFDEQLRWLKMHGWSSFTMSALIEQGVPLPDKSFAITFDDGYADNLHQALPILEKYDYNATLYLVVDRFERDWSIQRKSHHDDGELQREAKLSNDEVCTLLNSGRIELGSHSMTHANFNKLSMEDVREELSRSKAELERIFSVPVNSFAYPFGIYKTEHISLLLDAGYTSAVTVHEAIDNPSCWQPLELSRVKISGKDNGPAFLLRIRSGRRGW